MRLYDSVCLALFSGQFIVTDRVKIFVSKTANPGETKMRGDATILKEGSGLSDFVTWRTLTSLSCRMNDESFLLLQPEEWIQNQNNKQGREREFSSGEWRRTWLRAVQRIQPTLEDEKQFIPQMVNQAGN